MIDRKGIPIGQSERQPVVAPVRTASLSLLEIIRTLSTSSPETRLRALVGNERIFVEAAVAEATLNEINPPRNMLRLASAIVADMLEVQQQSIWISIGSTTDDDGINVDFLNISFPTPSSK